MDPHEIEAKIAIGLIRDFYGSVDSADERKSCSKQQVCMVGESRNEPEPELVSVGAKTTFQV